ncbi:Sulfite exporter TauE/SafE [Halomonas sp. THAF5a]|uniref:TSUP family transporter n=1 Tax=Halomonas sp. THAF5a TaxID=2587844 RepID=UPI0012682800|nr:TSUP family transporter [Halomonas sp. THAF5a]QFU00806.1 Sulfite exporter TauE/SafE [Halomonas sp. THAF5a]
MELGGLAATLAIMAVAGYLHTVSGFGLGMIVMGAAGGLGVASVPVLAAVVSLVTLVNSAVALPGSGRSLGAPRILALAVGIAPSIVLGVWLLSWLDATFTALLTLLLGALVLSGGISIGLQPQPRRAESPPWSFAVSGALTGMCGGLFGVPGPPVIYHCYRQPLPLETIRLLLILCFAITSGVRTLYVASQGGLTADVWQLALWSMPVVGGATWLGRRYPLPCSAGLMRRLAMLTLVGLGVAILLKGTFLLITG